MGIYDDVLTSDKCVVVGRDPSLITEEDWPSPDRVVDPMSNEVKIYHKGNMRVATLAEAEHLRTAAPWDYAQVIERLDRLTKTD